MARQQKLPKSSNPERDEHRRKVKLARRENVPGRTAEKPEKPEKAKQPLLQSRMNRVGGK